MPTSSPVSRDIMSDISSLARSRRVGLRSWASILRDISRATMTCTPRCSTICTSLPHCGRARAMMMSAMPKNHRTSLRRRIPRLTVMLSRSMRAGSPMRCTNVARRAKAHHTKTISAGSASSAYRYWGDPKVISRYLSEHGLGEDEFQQEQEQRGDQEPYRKLAISGEVEYLDLRLLQGVDLLVDASQRISVRCPVVFGVRDSRDLLERLLVEVSLAASLRYHRTDRAAGRRSGGVCPHQWCIP